MTGKAGAYAIGALNIQQREQGAVPSTNFTAIRVDRAILANSDIGLMLLNKDASGSGYNRVGGLDANFRFGGLSVGAYAVKTGASSVAKPGSGENFTARANFNYQSRKYLLRGAYEAIGQRFRDDMGFVPRVGVNHLATYGRLNARPKWASERLHIREIGSALPLRSVRAARRYGYRIALFRLARRAHDERQRLFWRAASTGTAKETSHRSR